MKPPKKPRWKKWILASVLALGVGGGTLMPGIATNPGAGGDIQGTNADSTLSSSTSSVYKISDQNMIESRWSGRLNYLSNEFNDEVWPGVNRETEWVYDIVAQNNMPALKAYLNSGGDLHSNSDAIMRMAASTGSMEIVKFAVENGADVTVLHNQAVRNAAVNNHPDIVKYLVEKGADKQAAANPSVYKTIRPGNNKI